MHVCAGGSNQSSKKKTPKKNEHKYRKENLPFYTLAHYTIYTYTRIPNSPYAYAPCPWPCTLTPTLSTLSA